MSFRALILALEKKIILEQQATTLNEQATQWLHYFRKQDWHSDVVRSGSVLFSVKPKEVGQHESLPKEISINSVVAIKTN